MRTHFLGKRPWTFLKNRCCKSSQRIFWGGPATTNIKKSDASAEHLLANLPLEDGDGG
jgi:hypothetical protein